MGTGPMSGRGAGFCAGYAVPGYANAAGGRGLGRGFGFFGRSRGRRNWFWATGLAGWQRMAAPPVPQVDEAQQVQALKSQAEYLTEALNDVRDRIEELQSAKDAPK